MNRQIFFATTLLVELIVLCMVCYFLIFSYGYMSALLIYIGYQITFIFGSYLVRAETLSLAKAKAMGLVDVAKQKGYLIGMVLAYGFYKILEFIGIADKQEQVYALHFILLILQIAIIILVIQAFTCKDLKTI
jgi:hypothetical protein